MKLACDCTSLSEFSHQSEKLSPLNPQTERQRALHWKSIERVRRGFYGRNTSRVESALNEQLDYVLRNVKQSRRADAVPSAVDAALRRIDSIYREQIIQLYKGTLPRFAQMTDEQLPKRALLPHERKQDEDDGGAGVGGGTAPPTVWAQAAQRVVNQNAGALVSAPNQYTKRVLRRATRAAVQRGLERGWGIDKIAAEIRRESRVAVSRVRARRIARTETIRASNAGAMVAADRSQLALKKEWVATMDDRVRATHSAAHGQTVPRRANFRVGGYPAPYPAAATLPPHESINCRCTVVFVTR